MSEIIKPDREPDLILPSVDLYKKIEMWLDENVIKMYSKSHLDGFNVTNRITVTGGKSYNAVEYLDFLASGDTKAATEHVNIAIDYLVEKELLR